MADLNFDIQEIAIATKDIEGAAARFGQALGAPIDDLIAYPQPGVEIEMTGVWVGEFHLAFVRGSSDSSPVARFLADRPQGLFEICLRTDDLEAAVAQMQAAGMRFTSPEHHVLKDYRWGSETFSEVRVMFVHPSSAAGVLIELQQWVP